MAREDGRGHGWLQSGLLLGAAVVATIAAPALPAQTIGEAARRAKELRARQGESASTACKQAKVVTDEDLAAYHAELSELAVSLPPGDADTTAAESVPPTSSHESIEPRDNTISNAAREAAVREATQRAQGQAWRDKERYWRGRAQAIRTEIAQLEGDVAAFGRKPG